MIDVKDVLAMERTKLASERTFLAYFRTSIVFVSSGLAIMKLDILKDISFIGYFLAALSPILLMFGIFRYFSAKKRLANIMKKDPDYLQKLSEF